MAPNRGEPNFASFPSNQISLSYPTMLSVQGALWSPMLHSPSPQDWPVNLSVALPCSLSSLSLFLLKYISHKERVERGGSGGWESHGGGECWAHSVVTGQRARERERGGRGKEKRCVPYVEKSIAVHTHTGLVSSWDYCSALRSDGGKEGMNR